MATAGLEALTGIFLSFGGDFITSTRRTDDGAIFSVKMSHSEGFKATARKFVRAYNQQHHTKLTVAFPRPFEIKIRDLRKSAQ